MKLKHLPQFVNAASEKKFFFILASIMCAYCEWKHFYYVVIPPSIAAATFKCAHKKINDSISHSMNCFAIGHFSSLFLIHLCNRCALLYLQIQMKVSRKCMCEKLFFSIILPRSRIDNNNNNNKSNNIKSIV